MMPYMATTLTLTVIQKAGPDSAPYPISVCMHTHTHTHARTHAHTHTQCIHTRMHAHMIHQYHTYLLPVLPHSPCATGHLPSPLHLVMCRKTNGMFWKSGQRGGPLHHKEDPPPHKSSSMLSTKVHSPIPSYLCIQETPKSYRLLNYY